MKRTTNEERAEPIRLYLSGLDCREVGKITGHSPQSVATWVQQAGHNMRTPEETKRLRPKKQTIFANSGGVMSKICKRCGKEEPVSDFAKDKRSLDGYRNICGSCRRQEGRDSYFRHRDRLTEIGRTLRKEKPELIRDYDLRGRFKITLAQFNKILEDQGGACLGCGTTTPDFPKKAKGWHVDHDHSCCSGTRTCGKCIRGILCRRCNLTLGNAKDDVSTLRNLADYVETYQKATQKSPIRSTAWAQMANPDPLGSGPSTD